MLIGDHLAVFLQRQIHRAAGRHGFVNLRLTVRECLFNRGNNFLAVVRLVQCRDVYRNRFRTLIAFRQVLHHGVSQFRRLLHGGRGLDHLRGRAELILHALRFSGGETGTGSCAHGRRRNFKRRSGKFANGFEHDAQGVGNFALFDQLPRGFTRRAHRALPHRLRGKVGESMAEGVAVDVLVKLCRLREFHGDA